MKLSLKNRRRWRWIKTFVLAVGACVALVWAAIYSWGIDPEVMLDLFLLCLMMVGVVMLLAIVGAAIITWLKKLF